MAIDQTLLSILACPVDKGPLLLVDDELLYNPRLQRAYPIENGIPVLLVDEARDVDQAEHESIVARAQS
ncbi:Trm112 family protein [Rhodococcus sp. H36-A4]|uniref:Trm112 family protein n=1 Tax=unclassified Rhodococcus (in: high G+C Gram-positive bacteria) TaxID=192944 RepID=UPI0022AEDA7C|nr:MULTISPECIES: Trm112 family protein [unclassified Rhodococcus (in: high G+C Gram-positive bacteria)]MCZ4078643.1 Trm112 family protein [Rhodococcus sp. H36-A4]MDJ0361150.1 Trm112 family protein [Rhodococcus sp. H29-C3]